jgi:hypothetical protein
MVNGNTLNQTSNDEDDPGDMHDALTLLKSVFNIEGISFYTRCLCAYFYITA